MRKEPQKRLKKNPSIESRIMEAGESQRPSGRQVQEEGSTEEGSFSVSVIISLATWTRVLSYSSSTPLEKPFL